MPRSGTCALRGTAFKPGCRDFHLCRGISGAHIDRSLWGGPVRQKGGPRRASKPSEPSVSLGRETQNGGQQKKARLAIKILPPAHPAFFFSCTQ